TCVLSTHPRLALSTCPYGHSRDGVAIVASMVRCPCPAEMIIFVPCSKNGVPPPEWSRYMAMVLLRGYHDHPAHAPTKPTIEDKQKLQGVLETVGVEGMTVQRLLNDPRTVAAYGGERLARASPAFADSRRLSNFIAQQKKAKYPHGMGWEGGTMNEWEIAIFSDRYQKRLTIGSLYCDRNTEAAFFQLFHELFDTVRRVTSTELAVRPYRGRDANCRAVVMDGEGAQALGYGQFLVRNIDELPKTIPRDVIKTLKSITGLATQADIDAWHVFCSTQPYDAVLNWYNPKRTGWFLPSINKFLSNIAPDDWDITPNTTNIVETAHARRNAETSIHLPLLASIIKAEERDDTRHDEFLQIEHDGVTSKHWNSPFNRERLSAQRWVSKMRKNTALRMQVAEYESAQHELDAGRAAWRASLDREKELKATLATIKVSLAATKDTASKNELKEQVKEVSAEIRKEMDARRAWNARRGEISTVIDELRKGDLRGVRIQGRRP
ncbi:hypothetical protein GGX14DRAFT_329747, partial [Mycena pura]